MGSINAPEFNEVEGIYSSRFKTYTRSIESSTAEDKHDLAEEANQIALDSMVFVEDSSIKTI